MKKALFGMIIGCLPVVVSAQLSVDENQTIVGLLNKIAGNQGAISNVGIEITDQGDFVSYGSYTDGFGLLGLNEGALFTTGAARNALGPNDNTNASQSNSEEFSCEGIDTILHEDIHQMMFELDEKFNHHSLENPSYCDHIIIEFDFIPFYDKVEFKYVFGSEEYPFGFEFEGKSDVFGLFVSGPGINGSQNIARLPNGDPVAVASVNFNESSESYVVNGDGSTPFADFYVQYDGYTVPLTASVDVTPCESYHFKIAIIDISWDQCDSGVFLEGIDTEEQDNLITLDYQHPQYPAAIEACNLGYFILHRQGDGSEAQTYEVQISGSATPGDDYDALGTTYTIPAGEDSVIIQVTPVVDNIDEFIETITMEVLSPCIAGLVLATETMELRDFYFYAAPDLASCPGETIEVNPGGVEGRDSLRWLDVPPLSCEFCLNPTVLVVEVDTFIAEVFDKETGCSTMDTIALSLNGVTADFTFHSPEELCASDIQFENLSQNGVSYSWDFGDGETSNDENPLHSYTVMNTKDTLTFPVILTAVADVGCEDQKDSLVTITAPFFAPNIFTPNIDGKNETLVFRGIQEGFWQLEVLNRWGDIVYEDHAYRNDWSAKEMVDGTYFYRLVNSTNEKEIKGWVQIVR